MPDPKPLIDLVQAVLIPGVIYGLKLLWDIREHLIKLNGRIATCEALRLVHEGNDERQHDQCEKRLETVERKLMGAP
jgi:hypothetical protein